jgi:hypothetical protein
VRCARVLSAWTREEEPGILEIPIAIDLEEMKDYDLPTGVKERAYLN